MERRDHWDAVYQAKPDAELSWFQPRPTLALDLIDELPALPRSVLDVGGGQSNLAGELLLRGAPEITVLDLSAAALARARERLGESAGRVRWIVGDLLEAGDLGQFELWHDRAVFHFLTDPAERRTYAELAARCVTPGGHVILGVFAPTGPERCSGLPVCRYTPEALAAEFEPSFRLVRSAAERHTTPWGKPQDFTYVVLQRV